jgi:uncharacterized protein YndB with AHSA1/START domain
VKEREMAARKDHAPDTTPIVIERVFDASAETIWKAITDRDTMSEWYFDLKEFRPEVGFEFRFTGGPSDDRQYLHICRIAEVVQEKRLAYSWRYDGYPGNSLVSFELFPEGSQTRVRLMHEGLHTFPADNPDLSKENFVEGWTAIIGTSLKEFLEATA